MGGAAGVLGDDATIRAAYVSHGGELYRFALRSLREPWLAEDGVQEVFIRAWRSAERRRVLRADLT